MYLNEADVRETMRAFLTQNGMDAITAWPAEERKARRCPVCVVSLRKCQVGPAGFQDYLGERFNEETGLWEELYGRRAELTLGLDLYAPAGQGEALQRAFSALVSALSAGGPEGLHLSELRCGETEYDQKERLLKRPAEAVCTACLLRSERPEETFTDFELRGRQA